MLNWGDCRCRSTVEIGFVRGLDSVASRRSWQWRRKLLRWLVGASSHLYCSTVVNVTLEGAVNASNQKAAGCQRVGDGANGGGGGRIVEGGNDIGG